MGKNEGVFDYGDILMRYVILQEFDRSQFIRKISAVTGPDSSYCGRMPKATGTK